MLLRFFRIDKLNDNDYWDNEKLICEIESDIIPQIGSYVFTNEMSFYRKVAFISYGYTDNGCNHCDICLLTNPEFEKYLNDGYSLDYKEEFNYDEI